MDTYTVEFRIEGSALVPSDVTTTLGLQPCQTRDVLIEEKNSNKGHNPLWSFDGIHWEPNREHEWESLEDGVVYLLEQLLPKRDLIRSNFGGFNMYWWCGHFQQSFDGGPTFSPELLRRLADFGVPLILRNYFSDEDVQAQVEETKMPGSD